MELRIEPYASPEIISFNYEELKREVEAKTANYETLVYTEDQMKAAKADRAALNRLKKALNDERIRREKEYLQPFAVFKAQIAEIIGIIDRGVANSDRQIKEFEERQREEKAKQIAAYWTSIAEAEKIPEGITLESIFSAKWLNASVKMAAIESEISEKLAQIKKDLAVLRALPAYAFEAEERYKHTLDLASAVSEAHRLQEQAEKKAAWEAEQAAKATAKPPASNGASLPQGTTPEDVRAEYGTPSEPKQPIDFRAWLTVAEAAELKAFFERRKIRFEAI